MKKALITYGGWEGHHPEYGAKLFADLLRQAEFEVELSDTLEIYCDRDRMAAQDLIVQNWTMAKITREQFAGLSEAVENGCGLGGFHGGLCDSFRENSDYQFMTGGQFVAHPGNIIDYRVDIRDAEHPVTRGLSSFDMHSEQYYMHVDPAVTVLATTTFTGEHRAECAGVVMPVVWIKSWGKGRVFYCSLGHEPKDFDVPQCREIIRRGLIFASERPE